MRNIRIKLLIPMFGFLASCSSQMQDVVRDTTAEQEKERPLIAIGIDAAAQGDTDTAINMFRKSIDEGKNTGLAYTNLGLQYMQLGEIDAAEKSFNASIDINPDDYIAYTNKGVIERRKGDFSEAEKMYQQALQNNPDYAYAHHNLAVLYDLYMQDFDKALEHYNKYQALTDNDDELVAKWIIDLERRIAAENR